MNHTKDDEIRNTILEAAKTVFKKWGLYKSTMEDIAQEAGKGKSTLYYYFKCKEEIFETVVLEEFNTVFGYTRKAVEDIPAPKEKLKRYIFETLTTVKNLMNSYSIVRSEVKANRYLIKKIQDIILLKEEEFIKQILELGVNSKEFSFINENELQNAAKAVTGIISAMELYLFLDNDDFEQIDIAAKLIANGI